VISVLLLPANAHMAALSYRPEQVAIQGRISPGKCAVIDLINYRYLKRGELPCNEKSTCMIKSLTARIPN
jgi:hypothetical protein